MDGGDPMAGALLTSLNALIAVLPPPRVVPALQRALRDLLEEPVSAAHKPVTRRPRNHGGGDIESWRPLRERILAVLAERNLSRRALAAAVKIPHGTLKPALLPSGRAPGRANLLRLRRWLASMEVRQDGAAENGGAREAAAPAYRLTAAERERLAAYRALEEERTLRAEVGIATEVIDAAIAGHALAPPIVGRLVSFLQQQQPAAPGP